LSKNFSNLCPNFYKFQLLIYLMVNSKKGVSAIVATVLIIMISVAAVAILWQFIIPTVKESLEESTSEKVQLSIETSGGYTTWDEVQKIARVQIKRGNDNANLTGLDFNFVKQGNSKKNQTTEVPQPNQIKVYEFNLSDFGKPEKVTVAPITVSGVGAVSSESSAINEYSATNQISGQVDCDSGLDNNGEIVLCNCEDLQNMNNDLSASYVLGKDIDCSGFSLKSLGTDLCENSLCNTPTTCERSLGCEGIWSSCSWDDGSNICDWDSDYCSNVCGGIFNESSQICMGVTPKHCGDSQALCETTCESSWESSSSCLVSGNQKTDSCTDELSCENVKGCASVWHDYSEVFTGKLSGEGKTVSNLIITNGAFFKKIGQTGIVENISFKNVLVNGEDSYRDDLNGIYYFKGNAATITLWNEGVINNVGIEGTVRNTASFARAAGIAIINYGSISGAFSKGSIIGSDWYGAVAGIVTENYATGKINNSYSNSSLSGYNQAGVVLTNSKNVPADPSPIVSNSYFSGSFVSEEPLLVVGETSSGIVLNSFIAPSSDPSDYFGSSGIPFSQLGWSTSVWSPQENDYPKLVWED
jgi:FlaG/FlaF family flagellin (archaellin)